MSVSATVAALLAASALPLREARALLAFVLGVARERLVAYPELDVNAERAAAFHALVQRRAAGEPIAYLLGVQEFYGRPFRVTPAVLVPRPETEMLVDLARAAVAGRAVTAGHTAAAGHTKPRLLDLGTGSGCLAITLALELPAARVVAVDRSAAALDVARANAAALHASVEFVESDWYAAVDGEFDLIVANPPYIAADDEHLAALHAEPRDALTDYGDGLAHLRAIAAGACAHLVHGGVLFVEHGWDQGAAVRGNFVAAGLVDVMTHRDAAGLDRVCAGRRP